jgi:ATP-binding cassette subfamily F protein uup
MANLVNIESASVTHGVRTILDRVSLGVQTGDRIGVLGLNGSGKTTLLRLLAGLDRPDTGRVSTQRGTAIAFVTQSSDLPGDVTVRDAVLHSFGDAEHAWAGDSAVRGVLAGLGLRNIGLESELGSLSGGERRRVSLGAALVTDADLLLLDEPTNHLDIEAVAWLADYLTNRPGAVVAVTHDRWFLDATATSTWEVVDAAVLGREGGYSDWVFARAERMRLDQAAEERRKNLARKELAWLRRGPPARTSKPRYRIDAAEALIAGEPEPRNSVELHAFARRRLGKDVLELADVSATVTAVDGTERTLLDHVTWLVGPGDRIGVVGINGSGKSTLLRILVGERPPGDGLVKIGSTVRMGYLSQEVAELPGDLRLLEAVTQIAGVVELGGKQLTAGQLAERFGFTNTHQWTRVAELSGGERRRLQLLRILMAEPNVLMLDEPTNDLDTDTLAALEDLLDSWPGTLLVVSHDRYLIERVADTVVALLGDGRITHLPGGVEEYLRRRAADQAAVAADGQSQRAEPAPAIGQPPAAMDANRQRALRKDLQRLERKMESLQRKETVLHEKLTSAGADYAAAADISVALKALRADVAQVELDWLAVAEDLESG